MQTALDAFNGSIRRVRDMHALHLSLSNQLTDAVDLSDMLRAEIVLAVSAFDFFIHELTRLGMLECHDGARPKTDAFGRFSIPLDAASMLDTTVLDTEIRNKQGFQSFQHPDKVADAIRLISDIKLWQEVANRLEKGPKETKEELALIVDRRNKIAHEADLDPSYPGQRWPIDRASVDYTLQTLDILASTIFEVTT